MSYPPEGPGSSYPPVTPPGAYPPPAGAPAPLSTPPAPHGSPYGFDPYASPGPGQPGPGQPSPPKRGIRGWQAALLATGTGVLGLVVGVAIGNAGEDSAPAADPAPPPVSDDARGEDAETEDDAASSQDDAAPEDDEQVAGPASDEGTRDNPYPLDVVVSDGEWEVMLSEPREAWTEVQAENQFNDPPEDGMEYWIVPLSVTYVGSETGLPWIDLTVQFVGDDARTYSDRCGVIPDDLMDVNELYEGGSAEGNVCLSVPAGAEGLWTLSTGWGGNTVFFDAGA